MNKNTSFEEIVKLIQHLRGPQGCLWDREQTLDTIKEKLQEEANEVLAAINSKDHQNLKEELGDLLWNIIFVADICEREKLFSMQDVLDGLRDKIIRRHPHVFGDMKLNSVDEILAHQKKIKAEEKKEKEKIKKFK